MLLSTIKDKRITEIVFSYLFGKIGKYEYRRLIGDKETAKEVWRLVSTNGYNCKLYAYAVHYNRKIGLPTSPAKYGINQIDAAFLRRLDLSHIKRGCKPYTLFDFDNLEGSILLSKDLKAWAGRFISKKLRFLINSYGLHREDIENIFTETILGTLRKQYPFYQSELHAINSCKAAVHNQGIGLIEFWTRGKRNHLSNEGGVFQAVHVQYDVLNNVGVMPHHDDETHLNMKSIIALSKGMLPKDRAFLEAAYGTYDAGFSFFLGKDNRDAVEKLPYDRYLGLLCDYHSVTHDHQTKLLSSLKEALT